MTESARSEPPCNDDCETRSRRAFLKDGLLAVAALTALGVTADRLGALSFNPAEGLVAGDTLRYPLPATDGATLDRTNKVIVVRYQGAVLAFSLECPHRKTALEWQAANRRFFCPKHKSTFQPEGTLIQGKAERNMDRFAVRIDGNEVIVETARRIRSNDDAVAWAAARATTA